MSLLKRIWLQRMEAFAKASPRMYYLYISVLAFIGYSYLLIFPSLVIAAPGCLVYAITQNLFIEWQPLHWLLASGLVAATTLAAVVSTMIYKTKIELPYGRPLDAKAFPILADRISELCNTYKAPAIHHIKLTSHFRIELIRTPSSGFPSKYVNTLLIGLPVMSCMSPFNLKLLLARHIGHLAKARRNHSSQISYLRNTWELYAQHYNQSWHPGCLLLRLFFCWYAPFFSACTTPAVRHEAFIKDKCMLEITTREQAAETIVLFFAIKNYLEYSFWPELYKSAYKVPKPAYLPYRRMDSVMMKTLTVDAVKQYYQIEVDRLPELDSPTPGLFKRLTAIGYEEFIPPATKIESATRHFLGKDAFTILKQFDSAWYLKNKALWNHRYKQGFDEKKRLKLLREQAAQSLLSNAEAKEYLLLIEKYVDPEKSLPLYQEVVKTKIMDADINFELGRLLLASGDATGVDALQSTMNLSKERISDCCHHLVEYMVKAGKAEEAQQYRRMIIEHQAAN